MMDKGYDHPLYSLDLLAAGAEPDGGADFAVPVPQGQLVVAAALRRRAAKLSSATCLGAVQVALAHQRRAPEALAAHGLTPRWAESLARWAAELRARERQREPVAQRLADLIEGQRGALRAARLLWRRLGLIAELGGVRDGLAAGRPPAAALACADALARCAARLADPALAERLAPFGLSAQLTEEVRDLGARLWEGRQQIAQAEAARARLSGAISVIRGALVGDLGRLCRVAAVALLPEQRAALRMERLLATALAGASTPGADRAAAPA